MTDQPRYIINSKQIQHRVDNIDGCPEEGLFFIYYLYDTYTRRNISNTLEISLNGSDFYIERMTSHIIDQCDRLNNEHDLYLTEILLYCNATSL